MKGYYKFKDPKGHVHFNKIMLMVRFDKHIFPKLIEAARAKNVSPSTIVNLILDKEFNK